MKTKRPSTLRFLTFVFGLICALSTSAQSIVEGRFMRIQTVEEFTEGDYLILSGKEGQVQALNRLFTKGSNKGTSLTIKEEAIINAPNDAVWELRKTEKGFSLKNQAEKKYLTQSDAHKSRSLALTSSAVYFQLAGIHSGRVRWKTNQKFKNDFCWNTGDGTFANFDDGELYQPIYLFKRKGSEPIPEEPAPNPPSPTPNPEPPTIEPNRMAIEIGTTGYATFFSSKAIRIPKGLKAYVGTLSPHNTLVLKMLDDAIPANTAVVLYAESKQTFSAEILEEFEPLQLDNDLRGTHEEIPHATILSNTQQHYFALANLNGTIGFHRVNRSIPARKAYLLVNSENAAQGFAFSFETNTPTCIFPYPDLNAHTPMFDLYGRRILKPHSGQLYLQNGKKRLHL